MIGENLVDDKSIRVLTKTYNEILALKKKEGRSIRIIIERAIALYKKKGGDDAGDNARP